MIGYLLAAIVSLLVAQADPIRLKQFSTWGFGSFDGRDQRGAQDRGSDVSPSDSPWRLLSAKSLNALLLGERYAESMGVAVRRDRFLILLVASLLAGVVTAFAGPIGFIGVAVAAPGPAARRHVGPPGAAAGVRADRRDHRAASPGSCRRRRARSGVLPLNAVTAILGVPVVVWVLTRRSRRVRRPPVYVDPVGASGLGRASTRVDQP